MQRDCCNCAAVPVPSQVARRPNRTPSRLPQHDDTRPRVTAAAPLARRHPSSMS